MKTFHYFNSTIEYTNTILENKKSLLAMTINDIKSKHAGSFFGKLWLILHPALLLSIYLFVYMVVFKMRFPGYSSFDYVLYVFGGLIPYIGFMDSINAGTQVIKSNIHLIKNIIVPIEVVPVKSVLTNMSTQIFALGLLIILSIINSDFSFKILFLPIIVILQILFSVGIVLFLAPINIFLPDTQYFTNLFLLLLMFISPIAFKITMVPKTLSIIILLNPIFYMTEMFRWSALNAPVHNPHIFYIYPLICIGTFVFGTIFFIKFKDGLVDYE